MRPGAFNTGFIWVVGLKLHLPTLMTACAAVMTAIAAYMQGLTLVSFKA